MHRLRTCGWNLLDDHRTFDARDDPHPACQAGQVSMSMPNTRLRRCARGSLIDAPRSAGVGAAGSAVVAGWPALPRLAGVTRVRYLLLGANTPGQRVRLTPGFGISAAR